MYCLLTSSVFDVMGILHWAICRSVKLRLKLQLTPKAEAKIHKLGTNFMAF